MGINIDNKTKSHIKNTLGDFLSNVHIHFDSIKGCVSLPDNDLIINCFVYQLETGRDILKEYISIYSAINIYSDYDDFLRDIRFGNVSNDEWDNIRLGHIREIDHILSMDSYWEIDDEDIERLIETKLKLQVDSNPFSVEMQKKKDKETLIKNYYSYIDIPYKDDLIKIKSAFNTCEKRPINSIPTIIPKYPGIISVFDKNNNVLRLSRCSGSIEDRISKLSNEYHLGCSYVYVPVGEKIINQIFSELCVYFNPKDLYGVAFSDNQSPYKSINVVKARYKGELNITLSTIKKVCKMYNIDIHYLNNGVCVVNKSDVDRAMTEYTGRDFINPPSQE